MKRLLRILFLLFRNTSCGEHFQGRFLAMREIKAADELRKAQQQFIGAPETIHFTGRNPPLFREARPRNYS